MIIAVGSTNPLKVNAVKNVFNKVFNEVIITPVNSPSKVKDQPMNDKETIKGALNRARHALEKTEADYGVGIEGGIQDTPNGTLLHAWTAIINKKGRTGLGCTSSLILPEIIAKGLHEGKELGPLIDELTGKKDVKHNEGTTGILTNGLLNREESYHHAIICALAPFINELY